MTNKLISKLTFVIIVLATLCVVVTIVSDSIRYNRAIDAISYGNYSEAREHLEPLRAGFRDREAILDYVDIMENFDPSDSANVYRSYRSLCKVVDSTDSAQLCDWFEATRQTVSMSYYSLLGPSCTIG